MRSFFLLRVTPVLLLAGAWFCLPFAAQASGLGLTGSTSATATSAIALPITDLQITGNVASSTPIKLLVTNGSLAFGTTTGVTFNGGNSGATIYASGTVANLNAALATLTYTRTGAGSDTLEVSLVNQGEIFFTSNNHLYEFVTGDIDWNTAKTAAEGLTAYGASGYLATITSQAENDFVSGRLTGDGWIGASDAAVEGDWRWVTGPENGTLFWRGTGGGSTQGGNYAHWNGGEPNQSGDEDCGETYVSSGSWNDLTCSNLVSGYVAEFGSTSTVPTVAALNIHVTTTLDTTPPVISSVTTTAIGGTTSTIGWTTGEAGTSKVVYSTGFTYASSTSESDTSPRVTSHSRSLSSLGSCTTYNYEVVSGDANHNYATSTNSVFTTTGCAGGVAPTSVTTTQVTVSAAATSTLADSGRTLTVSTPANFTATSTSVVIQVKALSSATVLGSIGKPTSDLTSAASIVFDVTALINGSTVLDSFASPVTISYTYTDADISGLDESTLSMYHYHNGTWLKLNNCSVNTTTNTITCDTPSFSTFAIFGTATTSGNSNSSSSSGIGGHILVPVNQKLITEKLIGTGPVVTFTFTAGPEVTGIAFGNTPDLRDSPGTQPFAQTLSWNACRNATPCATTVYVKFYSNAGDSVIIGYPVTAISGSGSPQASASGLFAFKTVLRPGSRHADVKALQQYLNTHGFIVAKSGPGSLGHETTLFGNATLAALIRFQNAHAAEILKPTGLTRGTGVFGPASIKFVNAHP